MEPEQLPIRATKLLLTLATLDAKTRAKALALPLVKRYHSQTPPKAFLIEKLNVMLLSNLMCEIFLLLFIPINHYCCYCWWIIREERTEWKCIYTCMNIHNNHDNTLNARRHYRGNIITNFFSAALPILLFFIFPFWTLYCESCELFYVSQKKCV